MGRYLSAVKNYFFHREKFITIIAYCWHVFFFFFYLIHYQFYTASQLWANKVNQLNKRHRCWLCNGTIFSWQMTSKQINYQHNIVCDRHEYISSFQLVYFILKLRNFLGGFWFKHQNWVEMKTIPKEHERVCVFCNTHFCKLLRTISGINPNLVRTL